MILIKIIILALSLTFPVTSNSGPLDYLFDRVNYWAEKSTELCYEANEARLDAQACIRRKGYNKCNRINKHYLDKMGECRAAEVMFYMEVEKSAIDKNH